MRNLRHLLTCLFNKCCKMRKNKFLKYGLMMNKTLLKIQQSKPLKGWLFVITIGWISHPKISWFFSIHSNLQQALSNPLKYTNLILVNKRWNNKKSSGHKEFGTMKNKLINLKMNKTKKVKNGENLGKNSSKNKIRLLWTARS